MRRNVGEKKVFQDGRGDREGFFKRVLSCSIEKGCVNTFTVDGNRDSCSFIVAGHKAINDRN
jgi:hypothetical protein